MAKTYYHCTDDADWTPHIGACLSAEPQTYYGRFIVEVELVIDGLSVIDVETTGDEISGEYPGDDGDYRGGDVIRYDDVHDYGQWGTTLRLGTAEAFARVRIVSVTDSTQVVEDDDDDDDDWDDLSAEEKREHLEMGLRIARERGWLEEIPAYEAELAKLAK